MDTAELLVELGTEEVPASMLEDATRQFARLLIDGLHAERLSAETGEVWCTPRRMIVALKSVPKRQEDLMETILGPPRKVSFDADGKPTRAAIAFAEKNGVPLARLRIVDTPK